MEKPVAVQEIERAITNLKPDRSPGPDNLTAEFYKNCRNLIIPDLKELLDYCLQSDKIPDSWKEARQTLLLKTDKNKADPVSYHPISLLNTDYKILTSILAGRLNKLLGIYVMEDQTGFIKGRFMRDNVRRLMYIMEKVLTETIPAAFLYLDAEKAFDQIEWTY